MNLSRLSIGTLLFSMLSVSSRAVQAQATAATAATAETAGTTTFARVPSAQVAGYTAARDSVLAKAAAYRSENDAQLSSFKTSFKGLFGVRRKIKSFGKLAHLPVRTLRKKHVVKHKTTGAKVEKVDYYSFDGDLILSERYVQGQLVRLDLFEFSPLIPGAKEKATERLQYISGTWLLVPGDYLRRSTHGYRGDKSRPKKYYFQTAPVATQ